MESVSSNEHKARSQFWQARSVHWSWIMFLRPNAKVRADVCLKSLSRAHYFPLYSSINYSTPIVWKDFRGLCFDLNLCLSNLVQDHFTSLLRVLVKWKMCNNLELRRCSTFSHYFPCTCVWTESTVTKNSFRYLVVAIWLSKPRYWFYYGVYKSCFIIN